MIFRLRPSFSAFFLCELVFLVAGVTATRGQQTRASAATSKAPILDTVIQSWPVDPAMTRAQEQALWEALCQPYTPIAIEIPLDRWLDSVTPICPIGIDRTSLEGIGLRTETPIAFRLDTPPRSLLVHLLSVLEELGCVVEIRHGVVRITTEDAADERLPVRVYDITPLMGDRNARENIAATGVLMSTIQTVIEPDGWETLGGSSVIKFYPVKDRLLFCVATRTQTHWQLKAFLDQLQRAGGVPVSATSLIPRHSLSLPKSERPQPQTPPELRAPAAKIETGLPRFRPQGESTRVGGMF